MALTALISLIEDNRGIDGDLYELVIPDRYAGRAERRGWRGGKLHALRPAFLELGAPAALVYEALEHTTDPLRGIDLIGATGLARDTVYKALHTLAAYNLARQDAGRWADRYHHQLERTRGGIWRARRDQITGAYVTVTKERPTDCCCSTANKTSPPTHAAQIGTSGLVSHLPTIRGMSALALLQQMLGATLVPM